MAVYTKLNFSQLSETIDNNYNLSDLIKYDEILEGIDNSNYIIYLKDKKYILTIFEDRIDKKNLNFYMEFKDFLSSNGIKCPFILKNKQNSFITKYNIKDINKDIYLSIAEFKEGKSLKPDLDGYYSNIKIKHCSEIGNLLSNYHNISLRFDKYNDRDNKLGIKYFNSLFSQIKNDVTEKFSVNLVKKIEEIIIFLDKNWDYNLPSAIIHADIFPDNIFFDYQDNLVAIIDFYFSAFDLLIYDIAIVINAWCFDENNHFIKDRYDILIKSYEKNRKLSEKEKSFLSISLIAASLRFLLTRLYDFINQKQDSLVKIKDPQEYIVKLDFFYNNRDQLKLI